MTYPYPPPPKKGLSTGAIVALAVGGLVIFCLGLGAIAVLIGSSSDDDGEESSTSAPASSEPAEAEPEPSSYVLVDDIETGLGREVTIAVAENRDTEAAFEAALEEYDAWSVTIVCASQPDPRKTGYILFGNKDDGVVTANDEACPTG